MLAAASQPRQKSLARIGQSPVRAGGGWAEGVYIGLAEGEHPQRTPAAPGAHQGGDDREQRTGHVVRTILLAERSTRGE
eukprot:scaffold9783_cov127-Isochrysis_galbana.AAC.1